jgi:D-alanyl-D-alanine carboxypeptidase
LACNRSDKDEINKSFETDIRGFMEEFISEINAPGMGFAFYSDTVGTVIQVTGISDKENNLPLEVETLYPIQSTTKMFLAIVALQLIDEGRLSLESSIDQWIDSVPNSNNITIKHLLQHTSGFNHHQSNTAFNEEYYSSSSKQYSRNDFINAGLAVPYKSEKFGKHNYSNVNYLILANIIESITHQTIGHEYEQRIFIPAQMRDTYYKPEVIKDTNKIIKCYKDGNQLKLEKMNLMSNAAGGIISTLEDMMSFAHWILDNNYPNLMSSELVNNMIVGDMLLEYGFGLEVISNMYGTIMLGHAGGNPGFIHEFYFSMETGEIIIFYFNEGNPREYPFRAKLDSILREYRYAS